ncbi:MAG: JAB domain-containing protein, partial [Bacteroidales bacterium]
MYPQNREIVLFGTDEKLLKSFVPEMKIRMNKGKAFDVDKVSSSADVYGLLKKIYGRNPHQENFIVLLFNRANKLIGFYKHTIGSSYATIADISMLVGLATKAIAHGVIISHNHPSGSLIPSDADRELTKGLRNALATVKINLLDHIIFTTEKYYSFADEGQLNGINDTTMINL